MLSPGGNHDTADDPKEVDVLTMSRPDERITLVQRAQLVDSDERDRSTGGPMLTVVLDPDDFTDVRDRLGVEVADGILVELADRLQARLCRSGVTTHLSHDHLGIVCIGLACDDPVGDDVVQALATPLEVGGELVELRAS